MASSNMTNITTNGLNVTKELDMDFYLGIYGGKGVLLFTLRCISSDFTPLVFYGVLFFQV